MFNPAVDDSEPLNPMEDGSGFYNKLADSPEFGRYNQSMVTSNSTYSEETDNKRGTLLTKTPTKQNLEPGDEQFSKKGTPKKKISKTPTKLRFNVSDNQASPASKKSNTTTSTTKHTRSASTGQQYNQPSPPPSPKFKHPYQQLKGGDTIDDGAEQSTGYMNMSVVGSPQLSNIEANNRLPGVSSDSPVHVDIGSPTSFFKEAIQSTPVKQSMHGGLVANNNPSFAGNNSMVTEKPISMATAQGMSSMWGASPQRPVQQGSNSSSNLAPPSEWIVSPDLREKFSTQFRDLKPDNGLLYGKC